ncbi:MAG: LytTR family DNA-binding domain-containing protein [Alcanivorax sp.]|nr:LytTR family DNA-binding domain-containing protein [Alcanivorax sp.]
MRVLVCDDEHLARERLKRLVEKIDGFEVVAEAANGREAVQESQRARPDVVLLDIRMPDMDGMEAAEHLSKMDNPPAVIFCTAYDEHALQAFKVHAVDYLLKPVNAEGLQTALSKAKTLNRAQLAEIGREVSEEKPRRRRHISARTHRGLELVPVDEIRYFLADQKYVTVCSGEGEVLIDETLKDLETEFGDQFVRIHRNALVALKYIEGMEMATAGHHQVRLRGMEARLTVSRRHVAGLRRVLQNL